MKVSSFSGVQYNHISHGAFNTVNGLFDLSTIYKTPYALAGRKVIETANEWLQNSGDRVSEMKHVFEDGNRKEVNAMTAAMSSTKPFLEIPSFQPSRDQKPSKEWPIGRTGLVQLQAADYLAYESRKAVSDLSEKGIKPHRKSLKSILGKPVEIRDCRAMPLAKFCIANDIRRKLPPDAPIYSKFTG
jgi:hypothetical protein